MTVFLWSPLHADHVWSKCSVTLSDKISRLHLPRDPFLELGSTEKKPTHTDIQREYHQQKQADKSIAAHVCLAQHVMSTTARAASGKENIPALSSWPDGHS